MWKRFAVGISLGLGAFGLGSWWVGGQLLKRSNHEVGPPPVGAASVDFTVQSANGAKLAGWFLPHNEANATVVLCHGYRGSRGSMVSRAELLHAAGYAIVMIDLQSHGESEGEFITVGHLERYDVEAAVEFAREKNPDHKIAVVGRSLGGAATTLTSDLALDAVVLEAVFPTLTQAVHNRVAARFGALADIPAWSLLIQFRPRLGFSPADVRPIDRIGRLNCPTMILCGSDDPHTPLDESQEMFAAACEPRRLVIFEGAGHVDLLKFDEELYSSNVLDFLRRSLAD